MGVYRADGASNPPSGTNSPPSTSTGYTPTTSRPKTFQEALTNAQAATDRATRTKNPQDFALADTSWAMVKDMEENEYRTAAQSSDPAKATADLDARYAVIFRGNDTQSKIFKQISVEAKQTVQQENPTERQFQLKLYDLQTKIDAAHEKLQSAPESGKAAAYTEYMTAVKGVINLQLEHELGKMPGGPGGSHTLAQWKQAAETVKQQNKADPSTALVIDKFALTSGYLDEIEHNPAGLNLTPAEQELAKKDPVALAFLKAAGITLDPNDPKLSPEMKRIAETDPILFSFLQLSNAQIWTSSTPVVEGTPIGHLNSGQYLHIKVGDQEITDQRLAPFVQIYNTTEDKDRAVEIGGALLPSLQLEKNDTLQALMVASDNARSQYATTEMKNRMAGSNPDVEGAIGFLNTQLNGFFDGGARAAFWESSGKPYATQDFFRKKFLELIEKPDPTSTDIEDQRELMSTDVNADKIGRYLQGILKDAPKEVADVVLDTVKSTFSKKWYESNQYSSGMAPRFVEFYKALSMAVELSPGRTTEMAHWLMDRDGVQGGVLYQLWAPEGPRFEGLKKTIEGGFGPTLSRTLRDEVQKDDEFQNMAFDLDLRFDQGWSKVEEQYLNRVYKQDYDKFMKAEDSFLKPFFQSFLNDNNIGREVKITSDTQLRNIIGKVLGLTPTNAKAAKELDYSQEWYSPSNAADWNTITLAFDMVKKEGGDTPVINALPGKYVSSKQGIHTIGVILLGSGPDAELLNITEAADAILWSGGKAVKLGDVTGQWRFDNLHEFQDENDYDDDGYIYLPKNLQLRDSDGDGQISSGDYERIDAARTTGGEYAEMAGLTALAVTGTVLMFIPGGQLAGAMVLMGTGVLGAGASGYHLYQMNQNGADISWSNAQARFHYLNIAGNLLAFGRLGLVSRFGGRGGAVLAQAQPFRGMPLVQRIPLRGGTNLGSAKPFARIPLVKRFPHAPVLAATGHIAGFTATTIGFSQMFQQAQVLITGWKDMNWFERTTSMAAFASGAATVGISGMNVKKGAPYKAFQDPLEDSGAVRIGSPRQTGSKAMESWDNSGRPQGGLVAALWARARVNFDKSIRAAWDKQDGESWWTDAITAKMPDIDARAQSIAGAGNPVTQVHRDGAKIALKDDISDAAFRNWDQAGRPKDGPSAVMWAKAQKRFDRTTSWGAFRLWSAEKRFVKSIGAPAYTAFKAMKAAGLAPEAWWTDAINAKARQLWQDDGSPTTRAWNDPHYLTQAENSGAQLGVDAYRIWNSSYGRQAPTQTPSLPNGKTRIPAAFTYRGWDKAGRPQRITTASDDTVFIGGTEKVFRRTVNQLKQAPTDYTVWIGAEKAFQTRIGKENYARWTDPAQLNRTLGAEDVHFAKANEYYAAQIAAKAYEIYDQPSSVNLPRFLKWRMSKGDTAQFWDQNKTDFHNEVVNAGRDWVAAGRPRDPHWKEAVEGPDMAAEIAWRADRNWKKDGSPAGGPTQSHLELAENSLASEVAIAAYRHWEASSSQPTTGLFSKFVTARDTLAKSSGEPAYQTWADAGHPDGWRNVPWTLARRTVLNPGSTQARFQQYGERLIGWVKDGAAQSWVRLRQRGGIVNSIGYRQHAAQTLGAMGTTLKWYGVAYAAVNAAGIAGWWYTNYQLKEDRTSPAIDAANAEIELRKLLANSESYVADNYKNNAPWLPDSDRFYQADGHLLAFMDPETGEYEYFRRIPEDMFRQLEQQAGNRTGNPDLYKPWVGANMQNQNQGVQIFMEDGNLYVYEPVKLGDDGQISLDDFDPLTSTDPLALPPEIKEQIGVRAYQAWVAGGRNTAMQSADLWQQAELGFRAQAGKPAYDAWVAANRPTKDENVYWDQAVDKFQRQIDTRALALSGGSPPTQTQKDTAQKEFGDQIALEAYTRWNNDGRKSGTLGASQWIAGEPALQMAVGTPAFDAWARAKRPVDGVNTPWKDAAAKWEADGFPILQKVAIRAPFRVEGDVDWNTPIGRYQAVAATGPIEGWRMHANLEWPSGDRYNAPTATTVRLGGPSPTQGWSWDVRQQDTTFAARVNLSIGTIEYNGAQVEDLTTQSRNGWTVMNTRAYLDIGNRNRERFDVTGKYARFRETGFVELGLGADFFKVSRGDMTFNVNGYYELQAYAPDFRAQLNWKDGPLSNRRGLENMPPPLGIDPALQLTLSYNPLRAPIELPYLSEAVG